MLADAEGGSCLPGSGAKPTTKYVITVHSMADTAERGIRRRMVGRLKLVTG